MYNTKDILYNTISFVKKYKLILISMVLSTVIIIWGVKLFADKKEAKIYEICAKQLIEISQNIVKHYQTSPNYWGLSTEVVIKEKLYTNNMKATNDTLLNILGKPIKIGADEYGNVVMPTAKNFVIAYTDLNKKQCIEIGSQKFNKSFWLNVIKITIKNDKHTQDFLWGSKNYDLPINRIKLKDLCQENNNNIIIHL